MTPDEAKMVLAGYVPQIRQEWETTKKVLRAVPGENHDYRPDPKARNADELAWHIVTSEIWFLEGITSGAFDMSEKVKPDEIKTIGDMIGWYEAAAPPLMEKLEALPGDKLAAMVDFFGMFNFPAVVYLNFLIVHTVHHRGQLSVYLRPMGGKVPSIYGGSADEPFEAPK